MTTESAFIVLLCTLVAALGWYSFNHYYHEQEIANRNIKSFILSISSSLDTNYYQFLNYRILFPHHFPLKYNSFYNLLISNGETDSRLNDDNCHRLIEKSSIDELVSTPKNFQTLLSFPVITYEIENAESLPFIASGNRSGYGQSLNLQINSRFISEIPDQDIKRVLSDVLNDPTINRSSICDIYKCEYEKATAPNESKTAILFQSILTPVCKLLNLTFDGNETTTLDSVAIRRELNTHNGYHPIKPEYVIYQGTKPICAIELKRPTLFTDEARPNPQTWSLCNGEMKEIVKQLESYLIAKKIRHGIIVDAYYLILIELDPDYDLREYEPAGIHVLPREITLMDQLILSFRTKILNVNSTSPTFLEGLVYVLRAGQQDTRADEFYRKLPIPLRLRNISEEENIVQSSTTSALPAPTSTVTTRNLIDLALASQRYHAETQSYGFDTILTPPSSSGSGDSSVSESCQIPAKGYFLQRSEEHATTVFKIRAKLVKKFLLDPVDDDAIIVTKIFHPYVLGGEYNNEYTQEFIRQAYFKEKKAVEKLMKTPGYNNIYLRQKYGEVEYNRGFGRLIKGNGIFSAFVPGTEAATLEVYEQAKLQLEVIHQAGIIHGDIGLRNILVTDKPFIYDFSHCEFKEDLTSDQVQEMMMNDRDFLRGAFNLPSDV